MSRSFEVCCDYNTLKGMDDDEYEGMGDDKGRDVGNFMTVGREDVTVASQEGMAMQEDGERRGSGSTSLQKVTSILSDKGRNHCGDSI